jgi:hypothetical protein
VALFEQVKDIRRMPAECLRDFQQEAGELLSAPGLAEQMREGRAELAPHKEE